MLNEADVIGKPNQQGVQWYYCALCFEPLFKMQCVVGSMGTGRTQFARRLLIVRTKRNDDNSNMMYAYRYCNKNTRQRAVFCRKCGVSLNLPVQTCLVGTSAPVERRAFRKYKRSMLSFSKLYQVIRVLLLSETPY